MTTPNREQWPHLVARAQANAPWSRADSVVTLTAHRAQIVTPSSTSALFNNVRLAVFDEGDEVDGVIQEIIGGYAARGSDFAWVVGPLCRPHDLGDRLVQHGMTERGASWGMVLDGSRFRPAALEEGVIVRRINADGVDDFVRASERGFGRLPSTTFGEDLRRALAEERASLRAYVAYRHGEPAGSGLMHLLPHCGVFQGSSVDPEHRGRGVYRALLGRRVRDMLAEGRALAVVIATAATSAPICDRFGFEKVCAFRSFVRLGSG